jgi:hypothetical protein
MNLRKSDTLARLRSYVWAELQPTAKIYYSGTVNATSLFDLRFYRRQRGAGGAWGDEIIGFRFLVLFVGCFVI